MLNSKEYNRKGTTCPYSPSCFTCPLPDCIIAMADAQTVNKLPEEIEGNRRLKRGEGKNVQFEINRAIRKRAKEVAERRGGHTTNNKWTGTDRSK